MIRQVLSLLRVSAVFICVFFAISCATAPGGDGSVPSGDEGGAAEAPDTEEAPDVAETPGAAEARDGTGAAAGGGTTDGDAALEETTDNGTERRKTADSPLERSGDDETTEVASAAEEAAGETAAPAGPESLPLIEPKMHPEEPLAGEEVSVVLDTGRYDSVFYDFGKGFTADASYTYTTFGVKTVTVTAVSGDRSTSAQLTFPVFGEALLHLEENTVQHDVSWEPVIEAELEAEGDFDTIKIYERGRLMYEIPPPQEYVIPVPFTGEREFSAALFHMGCHVADVDAVTLVGLNAPPVKPVYEGAQFVTARPGEPVRFSVTASDPNNDPVRYEVEFAPEDAQFNENSGSFVWTPTTGQRGVYLLHFTAYDIPYGLASPFTQRGILVQ